MTKAAKSQRAGGVLLAGSILAGAVGGAFFFGEPSLGFLAGLGVGLALLGLVWVLDR